MSYCLKLLYSCSTTGGNIHSGDLCPGNKVSLQLALSLGLRRVTKMWISPEFFFTPQLFASDTTLQDTWWNWGFLFNWAGMKTSDLDPVWQRMHLELSSYKFKIGKLRIPKAVIFFQPLPHITGILRDAENFPKFSFRE